MWSFPSYAHLPGINKRPDDGFLEAIIENVPPLSSVESPEKYSLWLYGLRLIEGGYFWEAHEVLEPVWFQCVPNSREKFLVQGIIQYANARLKFCMNRLGAVRRLAVMADDLLQEAARGEEVVMGISISDYRKEICALLIAADAAGFN